MREQEREGGRGRERRKEREGEGGRGRGREGEREGERERERERERATESDGVCLLEGPHDLGQEVLKDAEHKGPDERDGGGEEELSEGGSVGGRLRVSEGWEWGKGEGEGGGGRGRGREKRAVGRGEAGDARCFRGAGGCDHRRASAGGVRGVCWVCASVRVGVRQPRGLPPSLPPPLLSLALAHPNARARPPQGSHTSSPGRALSRYRVETRKGRALQGSQGGAGRGRGRRQNAGQGLVEAAAVTANRRSQNSLK